MFDSEGGRGANGLMIGDNGNDTDDWQIGDLEIDDVRIGN